MENIFASETSLSYQQLKTRKSTGEKYTCGLQREVLAPQRVCRTVHWEMEKGLCTANK